MDRITEAFEAAKRIVDMVEDFGLNITDPEDIINSYAEGIHPSGMYCDWGASRLVIWDDDCDFVIKIARDEVYEKYNRREVEIYTAAVQENIERNFAWCACYCEPCEDDDFYNPGIYVYEYLEHDRDKIDDEVWVYGYKEFCSENGYNSDSYEYASEYNSWRTEDEEDEALDYFMSDMDMREREAFYIFFRKWHINDVHLGNYSWRGNCMVIHDYAGWNW